MIATLKVMAGSYITVACSLLNQTPRLSVIYGDLCIRILFIAAWYRMRARNLCPHDMFIYNKRRTIAPGNVLDRKVSLNEAKMTASWSWLHPRTPWANCRHTNLRRQTIPVGPNRKIAAIQESFFQDFSCASHICTAFSRHSAKIASNMN